MTIHVMNPVRTFLEPLRFFTLSGPPIPRRAGKLSGGATTQVLELVVNVYAGAGIFILLAVVAASLKAAVSEINDVGFVLSILKQGLAGALNVLAIVDLVLLVVFLLRTTRQALGAPTSTGSLGGEFAAAPPSLWCAFALGTAVAFGAIIFLAKSPLFKPIPPLPALPRSLPVPEIKGLTKPAEAEPVQPKKVEPNRSPSTPPTDVVQPSPTAPSQTPPDLEPFGVRVTLPDSPTSEQVFSDRLATILKDRGQGDFQLLLDQGMKFPAGLTVIRLTFTLRSNGSVDPDSIVIEQSSGNEKMDDVAKKSMSSGAFPGFPDSLRETAIKVEAEFSLRGSDVP